MKCNICDKDLGDSEIQWDERYNAWDPCGECLRVISETFGEEGDEETEEEVYDDEVCYEELFPVEINDLE